jgi:hypothetical protein
LKLTLQIRNSGSKKRILGQEELSNDAMDVKETKSRKQALKYYLFLHRYYYYYYTPFGSLLSA